MPETKSTQLAILANVPQMTDGYYRARRQLALFSAILFFWEFVGLNLGDAATQTEAVLPFGIKVTIKNPEVIPFVLLGAVLYFWFRYFVEYFQCDERRRKTRSVTWDSGVSIVLTSIAVLTFLIQQLTKYRLAEKIPLDSIAVIFLGIFVLALALLSAYQQGIAQGAALSEKDIEGLADDDTKEILEESEYTGSASGCAHIIFLFFLALSAWLASTRFSIVLIVISIMIWIIVYKKSRNNESRTFKEWIIEKKQSHENTEKN